MQVHRKRDNVTWYKLKPDQIVGLEFNPLYKFKVFSISIFTTTELKLIIALSIFQVVFVRVIVK